MKMGGIGCQRLVPEKRMGESVCVYYIRTHSMPFLPAIGSGIVGAERASSSSELCIITIKRQQQREQEEEKKNGSDE